MGYIIIDSKQKKYSKYSMLFDGVDEYVDMGDVLDFERTDAFSIFAWIKPTSSHTGYIINKLSSTVQGYHMALISTILRMSITNAIDNRIIIDSTNAISIGIWSLVGFTYNGNSAANGVKLYINGIAETNVVVADTLTLTTLNAQPFRIGRGTELPFNGSIDDVGLFNVELTAPQVAEIYNGGKPANLLKHSASANLTSYWRMGDEDNFGGTNWTLYDKKGTNNGTSVNMEITDKIENTP